MLLRFDSNGGPPLHTTWPLGVLAVRNPHQRRMTPCNSRRTASYSGSSSVNAKLRSSGAPCSMSRASSLSSSSLDSALRGGDAASLSSCGSNASYYTSDPRASRKACCSSGGPAPHRGLFGDLFRYWHASASSGVHGLVLYLLTQIGTPRTSSHAVLSLSKPMILSVGTILPRQCPCGNSRCRQQLVFGPSCPGDILPQCGQANLTGRGTISFPDSVGRRKAST